MGEDKYFMDDRGITYTLTEDGYQADFTTTQWNPDNFDEVGWEINRYLKENEPEKYYRLASQGMLNNYISQLDQICCKWAAWMNIRLWDMSKGPELEKQGRKEEACEIAVKVSQDAYDQTLKEWVYDR